MQPHAANTEPVETANPVMQRRQPLRRGIEARKSDDQAGMEWFAAQGLDGLLDLGGCPPRRLEVAAPARVVEFPRTITGNAYRNTIAPEQFDQIGVYQGAVGLYAVPAE